MVNREHHPQCSTRGVLVLGRVGGELVLTFAFAFDLDLDLDLKGRISRVADFQ